MKTLPDSLNPDDCNCQQCKELRVFEDIKEYFDDISNLVSLTPQEVFSKFWGIKLVRPDSIAAILINKYLVVCKDGFIRKR